MSVSVSPSVTCQ